MDFIISYKFQPGTEKKVKSKVSSILKNTYEKKNLLSRLGYGRLLIDTKLICDEIKEKLERNNAIVQVEELEELPSWIKNREKQNYLKKMGEALLIYHDLFLKIAQKKTIEGVRDELRGIKENVELINDALLMAKGDINE